MKRNVNNALNNFMKSFMFEEVEVGIVERDGDYDAYVWPCAMVLAEYVHEHRAEFSDKVVLEVGAGMGLPGLVAAKVGARVYLTDMEKARAGVEVNVEVNGLVAEFRAMVWGDLASIEACLHNLPKVDWILGADVLYRSCDFGRVVLTLACLLVRFPGAQCIIAYQERSSGHTIHHYLAHMGLHATALPTPPLDINVPGISSVVLFRIHS
jgi:predicted nicotinamide N-methyase